MTYDIYTWTNLSLMCISFVIVHGWNLIKLYVNINFNKISEIINKRVACF
jgi:hypothetical protein